MFARVMMSGVLFFLTYSVHLIL